MGASEIPHHSTSPMIHIATIKTLKREDEWTIIGLLWILSENHILLNGLWLDSQEFNSIRMGNGVILHELDSLAQSWQGVPVGNGPWMDLQPQRAGSRKAEVSRKMATENGSLLTTGQAAKLCAVTPDTVLKWIKKGRLPATRTAGGHYRVALPDLKPFMAGFGQNATVSHPSRESPPQNHGGNGTKAESEEVPCWEFLSEDGEVREGCRQCVVYRVKATRCFLMAGLDSDVGHAHQFCEGSCQDCLYYRRVQGMGTQVLFISSDEDLVNRIEWSEDDSVAMRFARNGYEASTLIQGFRPEVAVLDLEGLPDLGLGLLDSIAADPRVPHIRVVLVAPPASVSKVLQRPRHRLVVGVLEKPHLCDRIEEVVRGSLVELKSRSRSQPA